MTDEEKGCSPRELLADYSIKLKEEDKKYFEASVKVREKDDSISNDQLKKRSSGYK